MYDPDENAPTVPNRPTSDLGGAGSPRRGDASPYDWMGEAAVLPAPPAPPLVQEGPTPRWEMPPPVKSARGGSNLRGFGVGFAVALVLLAVMALGLAAYVALAPAAIPSANGGSSVVPPTATLAPNAPTLTPSPTATPFPAIDPDKAIGLIKSFYTAISAKQLDLAYNLLSQDLQKQTSKAQFAQTWSTTDSVTLGDPITGTPGPGKGVTLNYTYQQVLKAKNPTTNYFQATALVDYDEKGQMRIAQLTPGSVQPTPAASPTPIGTIVPTPTVPITPSPSPKGTPTPTSTPKPKGP